MSDLHHRAQAILPHQSFIVQAPAGSGKTELLTQRILSLLATHAKTPESVLAITFTKKAAHEMRLRVVKALQTGLNTQPPETPHQKHTWDLARRVLAQDTALGWDLLKNPQRLQIMTIDALCASFVRQLPIVSNMGGMTKICDDPERSYLSAAKTTLKDLLAQADPQVQILLLHLDNQQQKTVELIASMLASREQWLPLLLQFDKDDDLRAQLEYHLDSVVGHLLNQIVNQLDQKTWQSLKPLVQFALGNIENNNLEEFASWEWPLPRETSHLNAWKALFDWCFTSTDTVRKTVDKRNGFPAGPQYAAMKNEMKAWLLDLADNDTLVQALQGLPLLPSPEYTDSQWSVLIALLHILPHACAQLIVYMQDEIDFSGVAQAALVALGHHDDPSATALKLDYQLQHILVDEFQDTSLLQFALLEKLIAQWSSEDGRTLFLVGDPMQSIYRFRQAEVGLFLRVQKQGLGQVPILNLHLQSNFRSDPKVIAWINRYAPLCFSDHNDMNLGAISYTPSHAARSPQDNAKVQLHATSDIIPCLQILLADDALQSIAILVRARSHLATISQALKQAQIDYQAVELEHLSVQSLIQDLMALTRAQVHLADSVAWLAILRAPFCGFSLADITLIRETDLNACVWQNLCDVSLETLSSDGQRIWKRIHPILAHFLAHRMEESLSKTIEQLWLALGGPACLTDISQLHWATSFFALVKKHEQGGTVLDMHRLQSQLEKAYVKSNPGSSRIQVMTLHKAKGLEFDAVILPELQRAPNRADHDLLIWEKLPTEEGDALLMAPVNPVQGETDPLYNFLQFTSKQKDKFELGRLLYVGMTRAKRQLHLFARLSVNDEGETKAPPKGSLLSLLWPDLAQEFIDLNQPESESEILSTVGNQTQQMRLACDWNWPLDLVPPSEEDNSVSMQDFSYAQHQLKQQGVLLHRLLCKVARQGLSVWDNLSISTLYPSVEAQLRELGLSTGTKGIAHTVIQALQTVLKDPKGRWILDAHLQHEAEAVYGSCVIDRTFIDEEGVRWIIDYKTSSAFNPAQDQQYRRQLAKYAQIFADRGEKNIRSALYFPLFAGWYTW